MSGPNSVVMAFSEAEVQRLTGISSPQLRYWDRTGFFTPAFAAADRRERFSRVYSFRDVVSLRILDALRNRHGVSLQHLRQVSEKLAHLAEDRWSKATLYVLNGKVLVDDSTLGRRREIVSGQYTLEIPLASEIDRAGKDIAALRKRETGQIGSIARHRSVSHNAEVVAGTRIPIAAIRRFHAAGYDPGAILREYPDLTRQDIEVVLARESRPAA